MKSYLLAAAVVTFASQCSSTATAQSCGGQMAANTLCGNPTGVQALPTPTGSPVISTSLTIPKADTFWNSGPTTHEAHITRLSDRLFVGDATVSNGTAYPFDTGDWLANLAKAQGAPATNGGAGVDGGVAQMYLLTSATAGPASAASPIVGLVIGAQNKNALVGGGNVRGFEIISYNNTPLVAPISAWGIYTETYLTGGSTGGTFGYEMEMINTVGDAANWSPHVLPDSSTIGLSISCGGGQTGRFICSVPLAIGANPKPWTVGLLFGASSLALNDGIYSAMSLPADYNLTWYKDATTGHTHDLAAHMSADTFGTLNVTTAGIASFSSDVRTLGSFQSTVSPTVKAQFDTTLSPAITVGPHSNVLLYVYGWKGFVFVAETTVSGSSAIYLFSNNGVFLVSAAGPFWEAPTTTPTNLSIAQNPTAANSFYIYNNNASSVTVHVQAFSGA